MADKKISQLPNGGAVQNGDLIPIARGAQNYTLLGSVITSKQDALGFTPVNKAGDTMTGNLSVPKISVGTTLTPSIDTVGEGLTSGASLAGVTQTTRRTTSRIGNAEINMHVNHLHSASSAIKTLNCRSKGDTDTHVSVASGDTIDEEISAGRYQSGGTGAYYPAVSVKKKIGTGTVSGTSMPGKWVVEVTPNGSVTPEQAFEIDSNKTATFAGAITEAALVSLASDASGTTDIGAVNSNNILLTGSNTITSFGTAPAGTVRTIRVGGSGGSQITHNQVSLITANAKNIVTVGNDVFKMYSLGSGNWIMFWYKTSNGRLLAGARNAQVGTTYTLAITDVGSDISLSNASAITVTIPLNSSVAFPIGTTIVLRQTGAGKVSVSPTGGVTLTSLGSLRGCAGQGGSLTLFKEGTDTWILNGDLIA